MSSTVLVERHFWFYSWAKGTERHNGAYAKVKSTWCRQWDETSRGVGGEGGACGRGRINRGRVGGGPIEERARNGVERRNGVAAAVDKGDRRDQPGCRWRSAWAQRAIRIAGEAPRGSSWMCRESLRAD